MDPITALLLGALQGLTEFLPVSSSGHLVLGKLALHDASSDAESLSFSVLVHLGSLIAILWVFRKDVWALFFPRIHLRRMALLIYVSIPAVILGLLIKGFDGEGVLNSPWVTVGGLLITTLMLWIAERPREVTVAWESLDSLSFRRAGLVGLAQAMAILPGVSRSGSTIATACAIGWERSDAVRLSFMMGLIALTGAGLLEARHISELDPAPSLIGFASSLVFSLLGLFCVKYVVAKRKLRWFAGYTFLLALVTAVLLIAGV